MNRFCKDTGSAYVVVVSVNAGYDGMPDAERGHRFRDSARLFVIDGLRLALGNRTKAAAPRADIAEQHEGRGAVVPALADVRTLCRLTNGVQSESACQFLELVKFSPMGAR